MSDKFMTPLHVEGDFMKKSGQFKLCEELQLILDKELKAGNTLLELTCCTNWPQEESIFASLANRLTVGKEVLTDDVYYSINDFERLISNESGAIYKKDQYSFSRN